MMKFCILQLFTIPIRKLPDLSFILNTLLNFPLLVPAAELQLRNDCVFCPHDLEDHDADDEHRESSCGGVEVTFQINLNLFVIFVISGSMEPSYYRGDILFLVKKDHIEPGDIIVY